MTESYMIFIEFYSFPFSMKKTYYFQAPIEQKNIELKGDGTLVIRGMASTKDVDRYNDIVEPLAFDITLETYMKNPIMLLQHDSNKPIGRFDETKITDDGLSVTGSVLYDEDGCVKKIQYGVLGAFSIGYIPKRFEIRSGDGTLLATENGYEKGYGWEDVWTDATAIRTIKELDLVEISVVSTPANPNAVFSLGKSVKTFFDEEKKSWQEAIANKSDDTDEVIATETPTETPQEIDAPTDADNVANEVLKQEETPGETPDAPPAPVGETPDTSETPDEPEGKSLEAQETKALRAEIKTLTSQVEEYKSLAIKLTEICEGINTEFEDLKKSIATIPMRKGMINFSAPATAKKGYISQLIEQAQMQ